MIEYDQYLNATHDEYYHNHFGHEEDEMEEVNEDDMESDYWMDDEPPEPDYEAEYDAMGV